MGKTIGVMSIKGGVGKTSSVIALGDAVASFGKKVLLVDANFSAPNLGAHFNVIEPSKTIHEVLGRTSNVAEAIKKLDNFDILPARIFNKKLINPLDLSKKIKPLNKKYDVIFIDSSPALNEESLATMLTSDEIIIVTTPDLPTLTSTLKIVRLIRQRDIPISGLIINKTHDKNFEISLGQIEEVVEAPVLAVIPYDVNVLEAAAKFKPSTSHKPNSKSSIEYKKLAGVLIGEKFKPRRLRELFKITPKRQEINREIFYDRVFS
ncbi:MAG: AAA family ATPase [Candidatus Pacearchaeota archaeon]